MAKKEKNGRIRVFFAEFEGDSQTIQEGLQAIGSAATQMFQSSPNTVKVIAASTDAADEEVLAEVILT